MSDIKPKQGADLLECVRLAFNARMFANQYSASGNFKLLDSKLNAEERLDYWLVNNLDGLPEKLKDESSDNQM